jgi:hypothetical protein
MMVRASVRLRKIYAPRPQLTKYELCGAYRREELLAVRARDLDEQNQALGTSRQPTGMITLFTTYLTTLGIALHYVLTTLPL